jgi:hypothetical protein
MPSLDEVASASDAEIEVFIRQLLRPGETFAISLVDLALHAQLVHDEQTVWQAVGYDRHILLLNLYGFLWKRTQPTVSPVWRRHREITRADVARHARSVRVKDPEDLDPAEIRSVYETVDPHSHRKKDP